MFNRNRMVRLQRKEEKVLAKKAERDFKQELRRADETLESWVKRGSKESLLLFSGAESCLSSDPERIERFNDALERKYLRQGLMVWAVEIGGRVYLRMEWVSYSDSTPAWAEKAVAFILVLALCLVLAWIV